ncbi:MAG: hypothetical protein S4CHLAM20_12110 [Chlamydiia bacterium]|nr:hypothetical protein [Chlamydiia bacterium]
MQMTDEVMALNTEATEPRPDNPSPDFEAAAILLFKLLDDIDTADDIAKGNDEMFRNLVRRSHKRRFEVAWTDGYELA